MAHGAPRAIDDSLCHKSFSTASWPSKGHQLPADSSSCCSSIRAGFPSTSTAGAASLLSYAHMSAMPRHPMICGYLQPDMWTNSGIAASFSESLQLQHHAAMPPCLSAFKRRACPSVLHTYPASFNRAKASAAALQTCVKYPLHMFLLQISTGMAVGLPCTTDE